MSTDKPGQPSWHGHPDSAYSGMARSVKPALKRTISFKIDADVADRVKQFLRDNSGKPLYLRPGTFAEQALIDAIERIEREGDVEVGHPIKAFANVRGNGISRRV